MQSLAWMTLLRQIPPAKHEIVVLVTTAGIEISMQNLLRLEQDYAVIRGRLSGTTDTGRIFFVPYDQMNYLGFQKEIKDADICAMYGEQDPAPAVPRTIAECEPPPIQPEPATMKVEESRPADPPSPDISQDPVRPETKLSSPQRTRILEVLRANSERSTGSGLRP